MNDRFTIPTDLLRRAALGIQREVDKINKVVAQARGEPRRDRPAKQHSEQENE